MEILSAKNIDTLRENTEGTRDTQNGKRLSRESFRRIEPNISFLTLVKKNKNRKRAHNANIIPQRPVENTTSIAP